MKGALPPAAWELPSIASRPDSEVEAALLPAYCGARRGCCLAGPREWVALALRLASLPGGLEDCSPGELPPLLHATQWAGPSPFLSPPLSLRSTDTWQLLWAFREIRRSPPGKQHPQKSESPAGPGRQKRKEGRKRKRRGGGGRGRAESRPQWQGRKSLAGGERQ